MIKPQSFTEKCEALPCSTEIEKQAFEFLSIASHELITPLTAMMLQAQAMKKHLEKVDLGPRHEKIHGLLDSFQKQMKRMQRLMADMLDLSRITSGRLTIVKEPLNFESLVIEVLERYRAQFTEVGVSVSLDMDSGLDGNWDRLRIEQVFSNLLNNVIKYAHSAPIEIRLQKKMDQAVLLVRDYGPGIGAEHQEKIFDRFERGGANTKLAGLGLGLFITKQIVESHDGTISVTNPPGGGACFTVSLPLSLPLPTEPLLTEPLSTELHP